ncbi:MAG: hypothetical protein K2M56_04470 [Muribaculaceae bacterium]|nr:hypothetical protein [Muribaculaceae bacterium]
MRETGLRHITLLTLWLAILVVIGACSHTPKTVLDAMDRAESLMENHPDSALAVIQNVKPEVLRSKADKARRSLLTTMAVDKNLIDTTDFGILKPALDYYILHGTPDQRLKTRYYEGRIWMNQGNDDKALEAFLRAAEDSTACRDSLALANLYIALGNMFTKQYRYDKYIDCNIKAAKIYKTLNKPNHETKCAIRVLNGATVTDNRALATKIMNTYHETFFNSLDKIEYLPAELAKAYTYFKNKDELMNLIYQIDTLSPMTPETQLDMAMALSEIGEQTEALNIFPQLKTINSLEDSLKYYIIKSEIHERSNDSGAALATYKLYIESYQKYLNQILKSDVLFTEKKYNIQLEEQKKLTKSESIKKIIFASLLVTILITITISYILRIKSKKLAKLKKDYEELIQDLTDERNSLSEIKIENNRIKEIIHKRVTMLNELIATEVSNNDKYSKRYEKLCRLIHGDKEMFLKELREELEISHSEVFTKLENLDFSEKEINCVCLLSLGIKISEASRYLGYKAHYNLSGSMRKKLSLEGESNIATYIQHLFSKY